MKSQAIICILALGVETTVAFQAPPQRPTSPWNRPTALKSMNDLYGPGRGGSSRRDDDDMDADVKTTEVCVKRAIESTTTALRAIPWALPNNRRSR